MSGSRPEHRPSKPTSAGRHIIVLSHPGPDSFNHSVAHAYRDAVRETGQQAEIRDLYALGFDPVLKSCERPGPAQAHFLPDVTAELDAIQGSDVFVLVYPIWFGGPPAMLKGYVDRVLGAGITPRSEVEKVPTGLLGRKTLLSLTTSASSSIWLDEQGQQSALQTVFDRYLAHAFGMRGSRHLHLGHVTDELSKRFAQQHLADVREAARRACDEIAPPKERGTGATAELTCRSEVERSSPR